MAGFFFMFKLKFELNAVTLINRKRKVAVPWYVIREQLTCSGNFWTPFGQIIGQFLSYLCALFIPSPYLLSKLAVGSIVPTSFIPNIAFYHIIDPDRVVSTSERCSPTSRRCAARRSMGLWIERGVVWQEQGGRRAASCHQISASVPRESWEKPPSFLLSPHCSRCKFLGRRGRCENFWEAVD